MACVDLRGGSLGRPVRLDLRTRVLDWFSELISNRMVDGINDVQSTTTTSVP
jgi:hypothetical protein